MNAEFWRGCRVLLTGHTGFKGSWLALWLQSLGAQVTGFSNGVPSDPALYDAARIADGMQQEVSGDVRDLAAVKGVLGDSRPEVVFHLAAQPLVRRSYLEPRETFEVNVMGTVNVLEAVRHAPSVRAAVIVTSDKCYENREWEWGYREDEPMGGRDPYSGSKGAAELVTAAYRRSFFSAPDGAAVASARAGNVIGGGDWGDERLVPDLVRALSSGARLEVRNPEAVRPWQHVLNPLSGYLLLAERLCSDPELGGGWNFGPPEDDAHPVGWLVEQLRERFGGRPEWSPDPGPHPHEAHYLKLDSSRARTRLGWRPLVGLDAALDSIAGWHAAFAAGQDMRALTLEQIEQMTAAAFPTGPGGP